MTVGKIFCSPMRDEDIPRRVGGRVGNEFLVCYDLVKIWKAPFQNLHNKNSSTRLTEKRRGIKLVG